MFGAPNGLCSSITESKHIKAVKELWRHSSHFKALGQMLVTNQWLDKLAAAWIDFTAHQMLDGACLAPHIQPISPPLPSVTSTDPDDEAVDGPRVEAAVSLAKTRAADMHISKCPVFDSQVSVFHVAVATYYAPSDHSGVV
ncbi:hypothetical protein BDZ94DRAFT_1329827 [Collybia nuda]|uniref:Uncharacterized protein n=1 Tax=Collybia nuda TaxID=64659 RepID=A0A9P5YJX4_9AGAR|nr:hypothetical protein BDZ94DRAFT_1329827 [Collybia nuda]